MNTGPSESVLKAVREMTKLMSAKSKVCAIIADEMAIRERAVYSPKTDRVEGFEDLGPQGRTKYVDKHVVSFMI